LTAPGLTRPVLTASHIHEIYRLIRERDVPPHTRSLQWFAERWQEQTYWKKQTKDTKRNWKRGLEAIFRHWPDAPAIVFFDKRMREKVVDWRDSRRKNPAAADLGIGVLRRLLDFAGGLLGTELNVAADIPRLCDVESRPEIIWASDEIDRFVDLAISEGKPELAFVMKLAALTGLRRSDLITLCKAEIFEHAIIKMLRKKARRRRHAAVPTFPTLLQLITELEKLPRRPGVRTLLVNSFGRPWTANYLTRQFGLIRDKAKIFHFDRDANNKQRKRAKHLHDVRGTFATKLMIEGGFDDREIAEVMGWSLRKVENIRRRYVPHQAFAQAMGKRLHERLVAA
jgi:integrase